ncbi:MAG: DinB family protein, partial [Bacteroidota bacterium]|nr:DinB family protein [Bacteroidota bacterium]MDX5431606.1 DinB family protein [Bacteroidota bacterium]MDX5470327.1 DinB family protein [Bacteroidota bacterium]
MAKVLSRDLLDQMGALLDEQEKFLQHLESQPDSLLNQRPSEKAWSALECIEHLNSYARYYLPEFEKEIEGGKARGYAWHSEFKSTWI